MNTSNLAIAVDSRASKSSASKYNTPEFWERLWRTGGIQFVALLALAYVISAYRPQVGASTDALIAFYDGHRSRILTSAVLSGFAILNLMWFAAALRAVLADAGRDGWGAAVTASSAIVGALFFVLLLGDVTLAYPPADSGKHILASGINDFEWTGLVLSSFPRAMLIMAGTFGLWRAGRISNELFIAGVAAVVLVLSGGTTWTSSGFWAPDGAYSRFVSPLIGVVWILVMTRILLKQSSATRTGW
jgi:hypothetical protein